MDLWTANPRVVSRDQILKSDCVVIARRLEKQGRVEVERVLAGDVAPGEELRVANLSGAARWDDGRPRILALSRSRRGYVVTELPGQQAGPLIYPAEPGVIDEIKAILREGL
ncbi:MAG TPA: hypothetical protein VKU82_08670 [Planctomycetaceae bacterium]|nr:hypothetical protein [Planctomycetaceae bacterium]